MVCFTIKMVINLHKTNKIYCRLGIVMYTLVQSFSLLYVNYGISMKILKSVSWFSASLFMALGLFMFAPLTANAEHQVGYSCENFCIVVVDPNTKRASILDCCGGWVSTKRIRHDRIFTFLN